MNKIILLTLIGALIGYTTNVIAIKLLFRPLLPIKIGPFKLQGLIPKRKKDIAISIGETVETELLSVDEIMDQLIESADKKDILNLLKVKIVALTAEKMPSMMPSAFSGMIKKQIEEVIDEKGEALLDELTETLVHKATSSVSIAKMVEDKINLLALDEIEVMVVKIAKSELKHIEYLGGVLGFLIGLCQGILIQFL